MMQVMFFNMKLWLLVIVIKVVLWRKGLANSIRSLKSLRSLRVSKV
mgnify:CR=1 FL=1